MQSLDLCRGRWACRILCIAFVTFSKMPTLVINSNVPSDKVEHSDLLSALSKAIAQATGKPEQVRFFCVPGRK